MNTIVLVNFLCSSSSRSCMLVRMSGSRALNASSIRRIFGRRWPRRAPTPPVAACRRKAVPGSDPRSPPVPPARSTAWPGDRHPSCSGCARPGRTPHFAAPCGAASARSAGTPMLIFWRRKASRSRRDNPSTSCPSMEMAPWVGSIRRLKWRISVDLPEPDSPMTTKIFWSAMRRLMSARPSTWPMVGKQALLAHAGPDARQGVGGRRAEDLVQLFDDDLGLRHAVFTPARVSDSAESSAGSRGRT